MLIVRCPIDSSNFLIIQGHHSLKLNRILWFWLLQSFQDRVCKHSKFFELWKIVEGSPSWTGGRPKTFPTIPVQHCVFRGNPESQRGKVLELRIVEVWSRAWVAPKLPPWFRIVKFSCIWQGIYFVLWIPNFSHHLTHSRRIPLILQILLDQFLRNKSFSILQFLGNPFHDLLGRRAYFSIPTLHTSWSANWLAWCSWNRWDSKSWLICRKESSELPFSQFLASTPASASHIFLLRCSLSSDGQVNFPFKDLLEMSSVSQRMHSVGVSISLFPLDSRLKSVAATDSLSNSAPVSWRPERPDTRHAPCFQRLEGPNNDGTLLAAAFLAAA